MNWIRSIMLPPRGSEYAGQVDDTYFLMMGIRLTQVAPISCGLGIFLGSVTG